MDSKTAIQEFKDYIENKHHHQLLNVPQYKNLIASLPNESNDKEGSCCNCLAIKAGIDSKIFSSDTKCTLCTKIVEEKKPELTLLEIKTAPKDGTKVLGLRKDGRYVVVKWGMFAKTWINPYFDEPEITHWQPLPQPPKED